MSGRPGLAEKRLSSHRFERIPDNMHNDHNPNDVTIDIPLTNVGSRGQTGARNNSTTIPASPSGGAYSGDTAGNNGGEKGVFDSRPPSSHGFGHRRKRAMTATGRSGDEPEDGTVTRLGRFYQSVLNFSVVTRYMIYVAPLAALLAIPIIVGATAAKDARIGGVSLPWFFCWIEVVWVSLWVCKLVAKIIPFVFQFLSGIVSSGTRKYALILRNLELPITTVLWMVVSLVTFLPIMVYNPRNKREGDTDTKSWEKSVKNVLFAFLVCALIFLGEKTLVQLISISYHRKQFDTRIKQSKRNIYLIGVLYDASRAMFPMYCKEFRDDDAIISDSILLAPPDKGRSGHSRSSSIAPLRFIRGVGHNVGRVGNKITGAIGDVAQEITGKQVFNSGSARSIVSEALERRRSTEALARRIWMSFVVEGREALFIDDVIEVLGAGKEAEAEECFTILDRDGNGDISLEEIILAISEIGRTRKTLNHSMHDVDQAIHVLDNLLATVAFIIALLVFLSFVTSGFGTVIAAGATTLLSMSFVFATTAQEVLGSCIFLFVKHPFDIGDRVEIDSKPYMVERISLLFSVFRNVNDNRITQIPNVVLNTVWIDNYSRSPAMQERLTIDVSFDTTLDEIQALKEEIGLFVRDKENNRDFQADVDIDVVGVGSLDKMELTVSLFHKSNWAIETVRAARRTKFMCALVAAVRKIPIRAPGAAAPEETPAEESDNTDDKPDGGDVPPARQPSTSEGVRRPTVPDTTFSDSKSTGVDVGPSGSVARRTFGKGTGASAAVGSAATAAGSDITLHDSYNRAHSPTSSNRDTDHYRTSIASPMTERHLSVNHGSTLDRRTSTASTGRRRAGTTTTNDAPPTLPSPTLPAHLQPPPLAPSSSSHQQQPQSPYSPTYSVTTFHDQPQSSTSITAGQQEQGQGQGQSQYGYPYPSEYDTRTAHGYGQSQPLPEVYEHAPTPEAQSPRGRDRDPRYMTEEQRRQYEAGRRL
ncbi:Mechanosensitive ion channel-domain-containing protein [Aspergillus venezuelensis]